LPDQLLDCDESLFRRRHLDQQVGAVDQRSQPQPGLDGALGVVGERRRHLEAHVAVLSLAPDVERMEELAGALNVSDRQPLVALLGREARVALHRFELLAIEGTLADRLEEDRRIGRDAREGVFGHEPRQDAIVDERARQVIEPDSLAQRVERNERIHCRSAMLQ
jgi:hypothetical protein